MNTGLGDILKGLYQDSADCGKHNPRDSEVYPTVVNDDREPVAVIEPDLQLGPWIAGGAALKWYQRQAVADSDIDVFCRSPEQAATTIARIKSYNRYQIKHESSNAVTISYHRMDDRATSWNIQVITKHCFADIRAVINSFDITVCQIATTGTEWVMAQHTARDIRTKTLRFTDTPGPDAVKRLAKYWVYGYQPLSGTIDRMINDPQVRWDFRGDDPYIGF